MTTKRIDLNSNSTITGSSSSITHQREDSRRNPLVSVTVATVTGTGPVLTPKLMHSVDGNAFELLSTGPSIVANGGKSIFGPDTTKPVGRFLRVDYDVSGSSPSFSGLNCALQLE